MVGVVRSGDMIDSDVKSSCHSNGQWKLCEANRFHSRHSIDQRTRDYLARSLLSRRRPSIDSLDFGYGKWARAPIKCADFGPWVEYGYR